MDSILKIAIITCSDTRAAGEAEDTAGKELVRLCEERGWVIVAHEIVRDVKEQIAALIAKMSDEAGADIVLTCGGTGLGPRDVTPEATFQACDRMVPGMAEVIRAESLKLTGRAMLSRGLAAVRGRTLVVNLPGSKKAAAETLGFVADQFEHAVAMMAGGGH